MKKKNQENKKKKSLVLKVLLAVVILLLVLVAGVYAFIQLELGKINRLGVSTYTEEDFEADTDADDTISDEDLDWGEVEDQVSVSGVVNILLIGQDTRVEGERARSDSMIVLSINKNTRQVTLVSLMRDLYVQIPGYSNNKLNAAFQFGGFELLDATIETNFGIPIDYNVEVDFSGFADIIDTIGGIDITLSEEEAEYLNEVNGVSSLVPGVNHLNGDLALSYARTRYVGFYDFQRTYRQRTVLLAIFEKMRSEKWTTLLSLYHEVADDLSTDLSNNNIISIAFSTYMMGIDHINSYRLPTNDLYSDEIVRGMDVLVMKDWNKARELFRAFLYSDDAGASLVEEESYS